MSATEDAIKRAEELRIELDQHNYRYYVQDDPSVSDVFFDAINNFSYGTLCIRKECLKAV